MLDVVNKAVAVPNNIVNKAIVTPDVSPDVVLLVPTSPASYRLSSRADAPIIVS
jgi:hypothetical protein